MTWVSSFKSAEGRSAYLSDANCSSGGHVPAQGPNGRRKLREDA